ncbi:MAG: DUF6048 family protein [Flavobacteriia bacterium]|nr:DUF6048 family protein [Flavobacteriia bacterium]
MSKYITSLSLLFCLQFVVAQKRQIDLNEKDTITHMETYGLRLGIDLSKKILGQFNTDFEGIEFVGDFRLTQTLYAAVEVGQEKKRVFEDTYSYIPEGQYLKIGFDSNNYDNWYGMNNMIHLGGRLAYSKYSQTVDEFSVFDTNRYWNPDGFGLSDQVLPTYEGLSALWLEVVFGAKVELFANIFLNASVRGGYLLNHDNSTNFPNNWVPGFNAVTEESKFGVSYNYNISYLIPLFQKPKVYKESEEAKAKRLKETAAERSLKKAEKAAEKEEKKSN